jgi:hypothetical protein
MPTAGLRAVHNHEGHIPATGAEAGEPGKTHKHSSVFAFDCLKNRRALGACAWPPRPGHKDTRTALVAGGKPGSKSRQVSLQITTSAGPGTRPEPAPTTHGGYGRNTTGGWLADDPRGAPLRPRACGKSGAGFGAQERVLNPTCGAMPRASGNLDHRAGGGMGLGPARRLRDEYVCAHGAGHAARSERRAGALRTRRHSLLPHSASPCGYWTGRPAKETWRHSR